MRMVVTGGSGFLGGPLSASLAEAGHEVVVLSRSAQPAPAGSPWTGSSGVRSWRWSGDASTDGWAHLIDGSDAVINLAGESIAARRWTTSQKARLERSRLETTRGLVTAITHAGRPPSVVINASAVGYYGARGDEVLTERSAPGDDFLARLALRWETEALRAATAQTRVTVVRTGIVLAADGGALAKMLLPFRLGLGGPLGSGRQYMAWIHREDWLALIRWLVSTDIHGAVNAVAPAPVPNAEFARALGAALRRPAVLPTPAFALRLALGEMADPLLLASQRAVPQRAMEGGFTFRFTTVAAALEDVVR